MLKLPGMDITMNIFKFIKYIFLFGGSYYGLNKFILFKL